MEGRVKGQRSRKSLICQNTVEGEQNPGHLWRVDLHHLNVLHLCCSGTGLDSLIEIINEENDM